MDFFYNNKKIIMIIGFVLMTFLVGYLIYFMFFRPLLTETEETQEGTTATSTAGSGLPEANEGQGQIITDSEGKITKINANTTTDLADKIAKGGLTSVTQLTNSPSLGATLSSSGNLLYYNQTDGKFYQIDEDGNISVLSDKVFYDVENVTWSPDSSEAIIEYPDGANIIYNFETGEQITLPSHWEDFDYSPSGDEIVMKSIGNDITNSWLAVVNDDGSNAQAIEKIGANADTVISSWSPNNQTIAMYTKGDSLNDQSVYFVGLNDENFKSISVSGRGFVSEWSDDGSKLLYSVYSTETDLNPTLWVANAEGDSIGTSKVNLGVTTWADKCVFKDANNVYCGVPTDLQEGSGYMRSLALSTEDELYQINIVTGLKKKVATPDSAYNISSPIISDDGKYLYFTDATTEELYQIQLK